MSDTAKLFEDMATSPTTPRARLAGRRKSGPLKLADVEYRVQFDEARQEWDVLRNGVATGARKKRASAIDSAIRDAKAELEASNSVIMVTCRNARKLETLWKSR